MHTKNSVITYIFCFLLSFVKISLSEELSGIISILAPNSNAPASNALVVPSSVDTFVNSNDRGIFKLRINASAQGYLLISKDGYLPRIVKYSESSNILLTNRINLEEKVTEQSLELEKIKEGTQILVDNGLSLINVTKNGVKVTLWFLKNNDMGRIAIKSKNSSFVVMDINLKQMFNTQIKQKLNQFLPLSLNEELSSRLTISNNSIIIAKSKPIPTTIPPQVELSIVADEITKLKMLLSTLDSSTISNLGRQYNKIIEILDIVDRQRIEFNDNVNNIIQPQLLYSNAIDSIRLDDYFEKLKKILNKETGNDSIYSMQMKFPGMLIPSRFKIKDRSTFFFSISAALFDTALYHKSRTFDNGQLLSAKGILLTKRNVDFVVDIRALSSAYLVDLKGLVSYSSPVFWKIISPSIDIAYSMSPRHNTKYIIGEANYTFGTNLSVDINNLLNSKSCWQYLPILGLRAETRSNNLFRLDDTPTFPSELIDYNCYLMSEPIKIINSLYISYFFAYYRHSFLGSINIGDKNDFWFDVTFKGKSSYPTEIRYLPPADIEYYWKFGFFVDLMSII